VTEAELATFGAVQKKLAAKFSGDSAVSDVSRVMRLPGFVHQKGAPFLVRIVSMSDAPPYQAAQIIDALGGIEGKHRTQLPRKSEKPQGSIALGAIFADAGKGTEGAREGDYYGRPSLDKIKAALSVIDPNCDRVQWFRVGCALYAELGQSGLTVWDNWSQLSKEKYNGREMPTQCRSIERANGYAYTAGTLFHYAKQANPTWWHSVSEHEPEAIEPHEIAEQDQVESDQVEQVAETPKPARKPQTVTPTLTLVHPKPTAAKQTATAKPTYDLRKASDITPSLLSSSSDLDSAI
jgi:hypothetical protein